MGVRLISNGGSVVDPAFINIAGSGVVKVNSVVDLSRTGGLGVTPSSSSSTTTMIFGVCQDYAQGVSDVSVKVIPFNTDQIWEIDCVNAASTAQVGLRHVLNNHLELRNTASDLGAGNENTAVFVALYMVGSASGSGKLAGYFRRNVSPMPLNSTTFS